MLGDKRMPLIRFLLMFKHFIVKCFIRLNFLFNYKNRKNVHAVILNAPAHKNIGDSAILLQELYLLRNTFGYPTLYFTHKECKHGIEILKRSISPKDIIFIHGGGYIGTLWYEEHQLVVELMKVFPNNRIVILPQTVYFSNDLYAKQLAAEFEDLLKSDNISIILRDEDSFSYISNFQINKERVFYAPDIFLSFKYTLESHRNNKVLLCFRSDKEKKNDCSVNESFIQKNGYQIIYTDMISKINCYRPLRKLIIYNKLKQFSRSSLVITDRLHAMVFAAVTNTPCIAFNNVSNKVEGQYKWLINCPTINYCDDYCSEYAISYALSISSKNDLTSLRDYTVDIIGKAIRSVDSEKEGC